jgi:phosphomannomutase
VHLCRDSYSGMAMFLDRMAETGKPISQLTSGLNRYYRKIGKVAYQHGQLGTVMQELENRFPDAETDRTDGLKLIWPDRWIHVRASNTEPILRFSAEARSADRMERMYDEVAGMLSN